MKMGVAYQTMTSAAMPTKRGSGATAQAACAGIPTGPVNAPVPQTAPCMGKT